MAMESLLTISKDENERARLLTAEKNMLDWQSSLSLAKKEGRREGIRIGEQRGIKLGEQRGISALADLLRSGKSLDEALRSLNE
jgi:hypothetical protein